MGTFFLILGGIVLFIFIFSNLSVAGANKKFYNALISKGYSPSRAKVIMDEENDAYGTFVTVTGGGGKMLRHWLEEAIKNY